MRGKVTVLMRAGLAALIALGPVVMQGSIAASEGASDDNAVSTKTPIKHLVVIFGENISFDHYYGTYPRATNPAGEPVFRPKAGTPNVDGLNGPLLTANPNFLNEAGNGTGAANPFRLDRSQNFTADQDHDYMPEQQAFDFGLMDAFPEFTGSPGPPPGTPPSTVDTTGLVMGYFDGNTVTALWNYAQSYALNDNSHGTDFGPSTVGAINLISGQTNGVVATLNGPDTAWIGDGHGGFTVIGDPNPLNDVCSSSTSAQAQMGGPNIGDLLNRAGITWGWFEGGFNLSIVNSNGSTGCSRNTTSTITGMDDTNDYIPHHEPFQYYASTANPTHARPTKAIGQTDAANHQYDIEDFYDTLRAGNLPAVSFLKAIGIQDAHPGYSSPLDEQQFLTRTINALQTSCFWSSTAVVILYDDSDGWYDHEMSPILNHSNTSADQLTGDGACGDGSTALPGINPDTAHAQGRCGYGPRLPLTVISSFAKQNFVDQTLTDQTSVIRFIEDNWLGGRRLGAGSFDALAGRINNMFDFTHKNTTKLILDENTGEPTS
jgi:phospholipase C